MRSRFLLLWVVAAFAVAALVVAPTAHVVHASPSNVVISAVYPGGGDATGPSESIISPYSNDYIEIFNAGTSPADITGWSVQYRHADGTSWQTTQISATTVLAAGQYYLIEAGGGGDGGDPLPTPDNTNAANMRRPGQVIVALMSTLDAIQTLDPADDPESMDDVEDLFGAGDPTNTLPSVFEGAPRTGILDNTKAWFRSNDGCQDTDNNLADFEAGPVANMARNTSVIIPCGAAADLKVTVTGSPTSAITSQTITYTVDVDNEGAADATNAVVMVDIAGSAYPSTITALSNNTECSFDDLIDEISCAVASIPTSGTFSFTFQVTPAVAGTVTVNATVGADNPEITGNNTGSTSTSVSIPTGATGSITSTPSITSGDTVTVTVIDDDLTGAGTVSVDVIGTSGDIASLTLNETGTAGTFSGTFTVANAAPDTGNSEIEEPDGTLTFTYVDELDAEGDIDTALTADTEVTAPIPTGATGSITSTPSITSGDTVTVTVIDDDLIGAGTVSVDVIGTSGDSETLTLDETGTPGTFSGTFTVADAAPTATNGTLEEPEGTLTFTYVDELDAEGDIDTSLTADTVVNAVIPAMGSFDLVAPDESHVLRTSTTNFQWSEASGATTYTVYVSHLSSNTRIGETYDETVNSGDVCTNGLCSLASPALIADLAQGTYTWTVIASNGAEAEASNGPNLFTVDLDGIELVVNGGLEDGANGWTFKAGSKRKCNGFGDGSNCAVKLGPKSTAQQNLPGVTFAAMDTAAGDVLQVSTAVRTNKANKLRVVMVVIKYVDPTAGASNNGKDKFKLFNEQATTGYDTISEDFVLDGEIKNGRVVLANTLTSGNLRIDDVSVVLLPVGAGPRAEVRTSANEVLPVPAAPDNFRGSN